MSAYGPAGGAPEHKGKMHTTPKVVTPIGELKACDCLPKRMAADDSKMVNVSDRSHSGGLVDKGENYGKARK